MAEPETDLDARYSDPAAEPVDWARTAAELASAELFWLSTVRADGRPHVTPVVAVWCEDALWFQTGEREQKFANLAENPQVVLTTGCNSWDSGLDVVVEGVARRETDAAVLDRVATAYGRRWDGRWQLTVRDGGFAGPGGGAAVFAVRPVRVFAHAKGDPFGATRHRFPTGASG